MVIWALDLIYYTFFFPSLLQDARGNDVDLSIYKGKAPLIVNVASQWYYLFVLFIIFVLHTVMYIELQRSDVTYLHVGFLMQWLDQFELHGAGSVV